MKRAKYVFISGTLSASMVLALGAPLGTLTAYASTSGPPKVNGWYEVSTAAQMEYIDQHQSSYLSSNIELMNNISLSGYNWAPLGNSTTVYSGTFNGNGYTISGWSVNTSAQVAGFFGETSGTIENARVQGNVTDTYLVGSAGGLVGYQNGGTILNSYSTGTVSDTNVSGTNSEGGLVGSQGGTILNSYSSGNVFGAGYSGGLVGSQGGTIHNSYATGTVNSTGEGGGLVGAQVAGTIDNSYETGNVSGSDAGGLVGWQQSGTIQDSYATGSVSGGAYGTAGGLVGRYNMGGITNSYFDTLTTTQSYAIGGSTSTTGAESTTWMQTPSNFTKAGWSTANWALFSGKYPLPEWQIGSSMSATPTTVKSGGKVTVTGSVYSSEGAPLSGVNVTLSDGATGGSWLNPSVTTDSSGKFTGTWTAPSPILTATLTASVDGTTLQKQVTITIHGTVSPPLTPTSESVTLDGNSYDVIGNYGYNPEIAVQRGTYFGYVEERAALQAGATFTGEGTKSAYMTAILSGDGVGEEYANDVTYAEQGQFAALYQQLDIIPTWDGSNVTTHEEGIAKLKAAGASKLAIENYLVQLDGYSWSIAKEVVNG